MVQYFQEDMWASLPVVSIMINGLKFVNVLVGHQFVGGERHYGMSVELSALRWCVQYSLPLC